MMGIKPKGNPISFNSMRDLKLSMSLITFRNCYNTQDFSMELFFFTNRVHKQNTVHVDQGTVLELFWRVKERKSLGPNDIGGTQVHSGTVLYICLMFLAIFLTGSTRLPMESISNCSKISRKSFFSFR